MKSRPRVLVLDGEQRKSLAVVRGLGQVAEIWTAASARPAIAAWSRYSCRSLRYRFDERFPRWLVDAVDAGRVDYLLATQEQTMIRACEVYDELAASGCRVTFPSRPILERALDKAETLRLAREVGVEAPRTAVPERWQEVEAAACEIGYPVVLKQRYSHFWNGERFISSPGSRYASTAGELRTAVLKLAAGQPPPLVQEFVPGVGLGIFLLMDQRGDPVAEFAHRRLRDVHPTGSGSVLRQSVAVDPELREPSLALLRRMEWWGVAMVEFRSDERSGRKLLMEVNGRFWGSLQLAADAGVEFPRLLLEVVDGAVPAPPPYHEGVHSRWWMGDLLRTLRVLRGRPAGFPGDFPGRWSGIWELLGPQPAGTRNEVLRASDPLPALAELVGGLRRAL